MKRTVLNCDISARPRRGRRQLWAAGLLAAVLAGAGGLAVAPLTAQAAPSCQAIPTENVGSVVGDIDADQIGDAAVGVPASSFVDVELSDGSVQKVTPEKLNISPDNGLGFGSAIALVELDHDGCADLAIGSPEEGAVYLAHGSTVGVTSAGATRLRSPGAAGDRFGASAVATFDNGDTPRTDLWIGAPFATVDGKAKAGLVYHYGVSSAGLPTLIGTVSYANIPGAVAADDQFGSVLSASVNAVVVGVPRRTVSGHAEAGEVARVSQLDSGATTVDIVNQDTPGVPGAAETGDHFGAAVDDNLVGVPNEDIGPLSDAGTVDLITSFAAGHASAQAYSQGQGLVPGKAEAGDHFGAAVVHQAGVPCGLATALVMGAPGEDIGSVRDAGSVVQVNDDPQEIRDCPTVALSQGSGLPGTVHAGARVGAALSTIADQGGQDEDTRDQLLVGAPGLDGGRGEVFRQQQNGTVSTIIGVGVRGTRDKFGAVLGADAVG